MSLGWVSGQARRFSSLQTLGLLSWVLQARRMSPISTYTYHFAPNIEETERLVVLASDWLELDSPDEGIRFDSELVSEKIGIIACKYPAWKQSRSHRTHSFLLTPTIYVFLGPPTRTPPLNPSLHPLLRLSLPSPRKQRKPSFLRQSDSLSSRSRWRR